MTSPMPVMMSEASRSATASIASRRRSTRSVRQSLASSTAERRRFPWCLSSFASKRSNSVNASAVPPAKPARIRSWYRRRTLRALAFTTTLPSVTWPSPPSATFPSRRADTIVVPRNCSMCGPSDEDGAGAPPIKLLARDDARDLAHPYYGEQSVDERVRAAYLDGGAVLVKPGEHLEHEAGGDEIDALRPRHVDDEHGVRRRPLPELLRERLARPGDISREGEGSILRLDGTLDRRALRSRARLRIPGGRRNLEGHGVIHRRLLELVLELQHAVELEQQRPHGAVGLGSPHPAGLLDLRAHVQMLVEAEQHQPRLQRGGSEVLLAHRARQRRERLEHLSVREEDRRFLDDRGVFTGRGGFGARRRVRTAPHRRRSRRGRHRDLRSRRRDGRSRRRFLEAEWRRVRSRRRDFGTRF